MQDIIIGIMNQFGYFGIAFLIALENIFPPIPSEVILTFGGFMTTKSSLTVWGVILSATIGSILGAAVLYSIGRWLSPERLERWLEGRLGRILRLKKEDVQKADKWFSQRGKRTVFFCRFIPIVRSLISIPAGISRMNMGIFLLLTAFGTALWNIVLVYLGVLFGASWETVVAYFNTYSTISAGILAVLFVLFAFVYYNKRMKGKVKFENTDQSQAEETATNSENEDK